MVDLMGNISGKRKRHLIFSPCQHKLQLCFTSFTDIEIEGEEQGIDNDDSIDFDDGEQED